MAEGCGCRRDPDSSIDALANERGHAFVLRVSSVQGGRARGPNSGGGGWLFLGQEGRERAQDRARATISLSPCLGYGESREAPE